MTQVKSISVAIPCFNEEKTLKKVIDDFKKVLPSSEIWVFDNNSTDGSVELARQAGAKVHKVFKQGKGFVVNEIFTIIDSDILILVDGDDTYPAESALEMINLISLGRADMVSGDRISGNHYKRENKRRFHQFGNNLIKKFVNFLFKSDLKDILTGYRAFSKRFYKTCPVLSAGFEIETEMTLHALDKKLSINEVQVEYRDRPTFSPSKLNTFSDGIKIIMTLFNIFKDYKPLQFYSLVAFLTFLVAICFGLLPVFEYFQFGFVYKVPSLIFSLSLLIISILLSCVGLILDTVKKYHRLEFQLNFRNAKL